MVNSSLGVLMIELPLRKMRAFLSSVRGSGAYQGEMVLGMGAISPRLGMGVCAFQVVNSWEPHRYVLHHVDLDTLTLSPPYGFVENDYELGHEIDTPSVPTPDLVSIRTMYNIGNYILRNKPLVSMEEAILVGKPFPKAYRVAELHARRYLLNMFHVVKENTGGAFIGLDLRDEESVYKAREYILGQGLEGYWVNTVFFELNYVRDSGEMLACIRERSSSLIPPFDSEMLYRFLATKYRLPRVK